MLYFFELVINGALLGSLYALAALAFVVVYKASRIVNFALGELVMFGSGFVALGLHSLGLPLIGAIGFGCAGMAAIAVGFNQAVLRHLVGRPVVSLIMVTIGLGAFLRAMAAFVFAGVPRSIDLPLSQEPINVFGLLLWSHELSAAALALGVVALVAWYFRRSRSGLALRAIADDQQVALGMGIDVNWHFALTWALAGAIAVAGGVLWTFMTGGGFSMVLVGLKVFPVVIIGGLDSIAGVLVGATLVGVLESLAAGYLDPVVGGGMSNVTAYVVLIVVLFLRPYGLFGHRDVERV